LTLCRLLACLVVGFIVIFLPHFVIIKSLTVGYSNAILSYSALPLLLALSARVGLLLYAYAYFGIIEVSRTFNETNTLKWLNLSTLAKWGNRKSRHNFGSEPS